jgi:GNAT superfamily N-acetyltransferase
MTTSDPLELALIECGEEGKLLTVFYEELLTPAFPSDELAPLDRLAARLRQDAAPASVVLARSGTGVLAGGIMGEFYPISRTLLLTYLVVRPDLQGSGVGGHLLRQVIPAWISRWRPLIGVGEVEDPAWFDGDGPADRLRLYARFPGVWVALPSYAQPQLRPGAGRVPGMMLLAFHVDPSLVLEAGAEPLVDGSTFRHFLEEYYAVAEGSDALDDPQVVALLEAASPPGGLRLARLADAIGRQRPPV